MTGEATLKEVLARLGRAMDGLEQALSARLEHEQDYSEAEAEVQRMNADRARLAQELDNSEARANDSRKPTRKPLRASGDGDGDDPRGAGQVGRWPRLRSTIDGKAYRMACDEGQEEHLMGLAQRFDRYVSHLRDSFGEIGDQRLTVMARHHGDGRAVPSCRSGSWAWRARWSRCARRATTR